ncbi:hypothetical protein BH11MYX1_BH11MYX1_24980 [soil metagenome]
MIVVGLGVGCGSKSASEGPPAPAAPVVAKPMRGDAVAAGDAARVNTISEDAAPGPDYSTVLAVADPWKGPRTVHKTHFLLAAPRPDWKRLEDTEKVAVVPFQPLVCAIDGVLATGATCGTIMPARATIRSPAGELVVERSKKPFHDSAGERTYPAPYGPACCMYNTCVGKTVPYMVMHEPSPALDQRTVFAVWPSDADVALEVAVDGLVGVTPAQLPELQPGQRVDQAFARGNHTYAAVSWRSGGSIEWDAGSGWIGPHDNRPGPRGFKLLATTDVDGDGHPELVDYQLYANDFGMDVFGDQDATPIYDFSCGNI